MNNTIKIIIRIISALILFGITEFLVLQIIHQMDKIDIPFEFIAAWLVLHICDFADTTMLVVLLPIIIIIVLLYSASSGDLDLLSATEEHKVKFSLKVVIWLLVIYIVVLLCLMAQKSCSYIYFEYVYIHNFYEYWPDSGVDPEILRKSAYTSYNHAKTRNYIPADGIIRNLYDPYYRPKWQGFAHMSELYNNADFAAKDLVTNKEMYKKWLLRK